MSSRLYDTNGEEKVFQFMHCCVLTLSIIHCEQKIQALDNT
jgi:hypothetical protein